MSTVFSFSQLPSTEDFGVGEQERGGGPRSGLPPLPCLNSNNCTEQGSAAWQKLASNHRKTALVLKLNVERLCQKYGIARVGFFTLTFKDHILCAREAQRRFHSLKTHVLNSRYAEWIRVLERHESGRIHYHLLVVLAEDIRTGVDFTQFDKGVYGSAGKALKAEWAFWRKTCPKYRFGRHELYPVKSTEEAIGNYVGKYIAKHVGKRVEADLGVRLVAYSKGAGANKCKFSWASPGASNYRRKLGWVASKLGYGPETFKEGFKRVYGQFWAFQMGWVIMSIKFDTYPTMREAISDWPDEGLQELSPDAIDIELPLRLRAIAQASQQRAIFTAFDLYGQVQKRKFGMPQRQGRGVVEEEEDNGQVPSSGDFEACLKDWNVIGQRL